MTAGAPEGRFHARKTILREGNQLVAELDFPVAEFVETTIRKNRHLANPLPCQKIQVIVIQGYSYFMNMQKCKESLHLL